MQPLKSSTFRSRSQEPHSEASARQTLEVSRQTLGAAPRTTVPNTLTYDHACSCQQTRIGAMRRCRTDGYDGISRQTEGNFSRGNSEEPMDAFRDYLQDCQCAGQGRSQNFNDPLSRCRAGLAEVRDDLSRVTGSDRVLYVQGCYCAQPGSPSFNDPMSRCRAGYEPQMDGSSYGTAPELELANSHIGPISQVYPPSEVESFNDGQELTSKGLELLHVVDELLDQTTALKGRLLEMVTRFQSKVCRCAEKPCRCVETKMDGFNVCACSFHAVPSRPRGGTAVNPNISIEAGNVPRSEATRYTMGYQPSEASRIPQGQLLPEREDNITDDHSFSIEEVVQNLGDPNKSFISYGQKSNIGVSFAQKSYMRSPSNMYISRKGGQIEMPSDHDRKDLTKRNSQASRVASIRYHGGVDNEAAPSIQPSVNVSQIPSSSDVPMKLHKIQQDIQDLRYEMNQLACDNTCHKDIQDNTKSINAISEIMSVNLLGKADEIREILKDIKSDCYQKLSGSTTDCIPKPGQHTIHEKLEKEVRRVHPDYVRTINQVRNTEKDQTRDGNKIHARLNQTFMTNVDTRYKNTDVNQTIFFKIQKETDEKVENPGTDDRHRKSVRQSEKTIQMADKAITELNTVQEDDVTYPEHRIIQTTRKVTRKEVIPGKTPKEEVITNMRIERTIDKKTGEIQETIEQIEDVPRRSPAVGGLSEQRTMPKVPEQISVHPLDAEQLSPKNSIRSSGDTISLLVGKQSYQSKDTLAAPSSKQSSAYQQSIADTKLSIRQSSQPRTINLGSKADSYFVEVPVDFDAASKATTGKSRYSTQNHAKSEQTAISRRKSSCSSDGSNLRKELAARDRSPSESYRDPAGSTYIQCIPKYQEVYDKSHTYYPTRVKSKETIEQSEMLHQNPATKSRISYAVAPETRYVSRDDSQPNMYLPQDQKSSYTKRKDDIPEADRNMNGKSRQSYAESTYFKVSDHTLRQPDSEDRNIDEKSIAKSRESEYTTRGEDSSAADAKSRPSRGTSQKSNEEGQPRPTAQTRAFDRKSQKSKDNLRPSAGLQDQDIVESYGKSQRSFALRDEQQNQDFDTKSCKSRKLLRATSEHTLRRSEAQNRDTNVKYRPSQNKSQEEYRQDAGSESRKSLIRSASDDILRRSNSQNSTCSKRSELNLRPSDSRDQNIDAKSYGKSHRSFQEKDRGAEDMDIKSKANRRKSIFLTPGEEPQDQEMDAKSFKSRIPTYTTREEDPQEEDMDGKYFKSRRSTYTTRGEDRLDQNMNAEFTKPRKSTYTKRGEDPREQDEDAKSFQSRKSAYTSREDRQEQVVEVKSPKFRKSTYTIRGQDPREQDEDRKFFKSWNSTYTTRGEDPQETNIIKTPKSTYTTRGEGPPEQEEDAREDPAQEMDAKSHKSRKSTYTKPGGDLEAQDVSSKSNKSRRFTNTSRGEDALSLDLDAKSYSKSQRPTYTTSGEDSRIQDLDTKTSREDRSEQVADSNARKSEKPRRSISEYVLRRPQDQEQAEKSQKSRYGPSAGSSHSMSYTDSKLRNLENRSDMKHDSDYTTQAPPPTHMSAISSYSQDAGPSTQNATLNAVSPYRSRAITLSSGSDRSKGGATPEIGLSLRSIKVESIHQVIEQLRGSRSANQFFVSVLPEMIQSKMFRINVIDKEKGDLLGYFYIDEEKFHKAREQGVFDNYLALFVLNSIGSLTDFKTGINPKVLKRYQCYGKCNCEKHDNGQ